MPLPDREASLLRRVTETSSGTLWMVRIMAVSPLAGLKQSMPTYSKKRKKFYWNNRDTCNWKSQMHI